jgi:hypothetical protein
MSASDDDVGTDVSIGFHNVQCLQFCHSNRFRNSDVLPSSVGKGGKVTTELGSFEGTSLNLGSN